MLFARWSAGGRCIPGAEKDGGEFVDTSRQVRHGGGRRLPDKRSRDPVATSRAHLTMMGIRCARRVQLLSHGSGILSGPFEDAFQIFFNRRRWSQVKVVHKDLEHVGREERRKRRPEANPLDAEGEEH